MKNILVFSDIFFHFSETFLYQQVKNLKKDYRVTICGNKFINKEIYSFEGFEQLEFAENQNLFDKYLTKVLRKIYDPTLDFGILTTWKLQSFFKNYQGIVHAHFGTHAVKMLRFAKKNNLPLVVTFHGYDASRALNNKKYTKRLPGLFNYASAIVVVSPHMIEKLGLQPWIHKVHVVPCSIDTNEFKPVNQALAIENKTIHIIHAGRLVEKKGVMDLITVFSQLLQVNPSLKLHILGDGPEKENCLTLSRQLGIEHKTVFYGAKPHSFVKQLMQDCDIFVLNSRIATNGDSEGMPVTLLEAMSMEKAVVSTIHAGIPLAVDDHVHGILVPEKDNAGLYEAMLELIQNPELRQRLGTAARKKILEQFTNEKMNAELRKIYQSLSKTVKKQTL